MKKIKNSKKSSQSKKRVVKKKPKNKEMDKDMYLASLTYGGGNMSDRDRYDSIRILDAVYSFVRQPTHR